MRVRAHVIEDFLIRAERLLKRSPRPPGCFRIDWHRKRMLRGRGFMPLPDTVYRKANLSWNGRCFLPWFRWTWASLSYVVGSYVYLATCICLPPGLGPSKRVNLGKRRICYRKRDLMLGCSRRTRRTCYQKNDLMLGCSRRDSNPRLRLERPRSLTGLDYGSGRPG